jgi:hypothetical protein
LCKARTMPVTIDIDYDLACAVALGLIDSDRLVATAHQLTVLDPSARAVGVYSHWLRSDDPLHRATSDYFTARAAAVETPTTKSGITSWLRRDSQQAASPSLDRATRAKQLARKLLTERGVFARAARLGLRTRS